jgi:hypothetical protein
MIENAIALLLAQHETYQAAMPPAPVVTITMAPLPSRQAAPKRIAKTEPSKQTAQSMHTSGVIVGGLDATSFLTAIRRAATREASIQAIHAYCGYDPQADFGSQDLAARSQAARQLNPNKVKAGLDRTKIKSASQSLSGYVAGMPNTLASRLEDLSARQAHTAEAIIDLDKIIAASPQGELHPIQVADQVVPAALERNRLQALLLNVQEQLQKYGV